MRGNDVFEVGFLMCMIEEMGYDEIIKDDENKMHVISSFFDSPIFSDLTKSIKYVV